MAEGRSRIVEVDGRYHVWTRRVGEGDPAVLLLHGGPGATHEYFEVFERHLPAAGVPFIYYDQLGSYFSDQPDDPGLWTVDRFREEVEQVRRALGLERFILLGQSWGGMLAIEYALRYGDHLAGLVVSNMTASIAAYMASIQALRRALPEEVQREFEAHERAGDYSNPRYVELMERELYQRHLCRLDPWPDPLRRSLERIAMPVYGTMQGPNEFVVNGTFRDWDRWDRLCDLTMPTLLLVGRHDTMSVADIEEMGRRIPGADVGVCERGSHIAQWDDEDAYFGHLMPFLSRVRAGA